MPLSPEQEQQAVDAIAALGWVDRYEAAKNAVSRTLAITDEEAERIVKRLSDRRIIRFEMKTNDVGENGHATQSLMTWTRAEIPTTLELVNYLMALEGHITLDSSREAVSRFCGCKSTRPMTFCTLCETEIY